MKLSNPVLRGRTQLNCVSMIQDRPMRKKLRKKSPKKFETISMDGSWVAEVRNGPAVPESENRCNGHHESASCAWQQRDGLEAKVGWQFTSEMRVKLKPRHLTNDMTLVSTVHRYGEVLSTTQASRAIRSGRLMWRLVRYSNSDKQARGGWLWISTP